MATQDTRVVEYDVVIVGGGPVGLILAYQLTRFGLSACVLEQYEKEAQDNYGRAIALFPRTIEQLDQLDLLEPMLQLGFACRTSVTYKNGERVLPGRVWAFMEGIEGTTFDFTLVLRQMYTEAILREKLEEIGASYFHATECKGFTVDETVPLDSYGVTSTFINKKTQQTFDLRSKYLIGADGGRSFVRNHAQIPFEGDTTEDEWIRIDGIVETDMPINRSYGAIESDTHGNVLWAPLDHGATRIGYAYTPQIASKYPGGITEEVAVKEAMESMKPFNVKFREVHWWTLYTIGQRIAKNWAFKNRVLLCGDSAHTHSSGAAQGLNTGIHDAVNLGWKLAFQCRGISQPGVLDTYETERIMAVQKLINYDKDIATLMSRKWPAWYKGDPEADPYLVLGDIFHQAASFNTGLGIAYSVNVLNQDATTPLNVVVGGRPPDVELTTPGTYQKTRLQRVTLNLAKFHVVVFTGDINITRPIIEELRKYLQINEGIERHDTVQWLTISPAVGCSPFEAIGTKPFGRTYFDGNNTAHQKYGVNPEKGGVVILRPDGLVGSGGPIFGAWIAGYFSKVLKPLL